MATLSAGQLVQLARGAGWSLQQAPTVAAIALAESGGRSDVVGKLNRDGSRDYGLWQINSVHNPTAKAWSDPATNAAMARQVYLTAPGGPSFKPWAAYNNQAYVLYLPRTKAAASQQRGGYVPGGGSAPTGCPRAGTTSKKPPPSNPAMPGTESPKTDIHMGELFGHGKGQVYETPKGCNYIWYPDKKVRKWIEPIRAATTEEQYREILPGPLVDAADAAGAAVDFLDWITTGDNWVRILYVALGGATVVAGLVVVAKSQKG